MKKTTKHCCLLCESLKSHPIVRKVHRVLTRVVETDTSGRQVVSSKYVVYDPSRELSKYRVADFSISSLQSVGADLHLTSLSVDSHSALDSVKRSIINLEE